MALLRDPYARIRAIAEGRDPDAEDVLLAQQAPLMDAEEQRRMQLEQSSSRMSQSALALRQGTEGVKSSLISAKGLVRTLAGDETGGLEDLRRAQQMQQDATEYGPDVQSIDDIDSVGSGLAWARNMALQQIPNIGLSVVGGLAGAGGRLALGGLARGAGAKALAGAAERKVVKDTLGNAIEDPIADRARAAIAEPVVRNIQKEIAQGTAAGGAASGVALQSSMAPGIVLDTDENNTASIQERARTAAMGALATGSLESLPVMALFKKFGLGGAAQEISGGVMARMSKQFAKQGTTEAMTEVAQTVGERMAHRYVNDNVEMLGTEAYSEYLNAAAGGFIGGGLFGAPAGLRGSGKDGPAYGKMREKVGSVFEKAFGGKKGEGPAPGEELGAAPGPEGPAPAAPPGSPEEVVNQARRQAEDILGAAKNAGGKAGEAIKSAYDKVAPLFKETYDKIRKDMDTSNAIDEIFAKELSSAENYGYKIDASGIANLNNGSGTPFAHKFVDEGLAADYKSEGHSTARSAVMATLPPERVVELGDGIDAAMTVLTGDIEDVDGDHLRSYIEALSGPARNEFARAAGTALQLREQGAEFDVEDERAPLRYDEADTAEDSTPSDSIDGLSYNEEQGMGEETALRNTKDAVAAWRNEGGRPIRNDAPAPKNTIVLRDEKGARRTLSGYALGKMLLDARKEDPTYGEGKQDVQVAKLLSDFAVEGYQFEPDSLQPLNLGSGWMLTADHVNKLKATAMKPTGRLPAVAAPDKLFGAKRVQAEKLPAVERPYKSDIGEKYNEKVDTSKNELDDMIGEKPGPRETSPQGMRATLRGADTDKRTARSSKAMAKTDKARDMLDRALMSISGEDVSAEYGEAFNKIYDEEMAGLDRDDEDARFDANDRITARVAEISKNFRATPPPTEILNEDQRRELFLKAIKSGVGKDKGSRIGAMLRENAALYKAAKAAEAEALVIGKKEERAVMPEGKISITEGQVHDNTKVDVKQAVIEREADVSPELDQILAARFGSGKMTFKQRREFYAALQAELVDQVKNDANPAKARAALAALRKAGAEFGERMKLITIEKLKAARKAYFAVFDTDNARAYIDPTVSKSDQEKMYKDLKFTKNESNPTGLFTWLRYMKKDAREDVLGVLPAPIEKTLRAYLKAQTNYWMSDLEAKAEPKSRDRTSVDEVARRQTQIETDAARAGGTQKGLSTLAAEGNDRDLGGPFSQIDSEKAAPAKTDEKAKAAAQAMREKAKRDKPITDQRTADAARIKAEDKAGTITPAQRRADIKRDKARIDAMIVEQRAKDAAETQLGRDVGKALGSVRSDMNTSQMRDDVSLDFNNKRVQENLSAAGIFEWQDPEIVGWGSRNRFEVLHNAYKQYLTPEDTMGAARAARMAVDDIFNSAGQEYINKIMDSRVPGGDFRAYVKQQMEGMPSPQDRAWLENDGEGAIKAAWDKLSAAEKLAANARKVETKRENEAFHNRMEAAGVPHEFRVMDSDGHGLYPLSKYQNDHSYYTEKKDGKVVLTYTPTIEPWFNDEPGASSPEEEAATEREMAAKEDKFYKDNPPQDLGTFDTIEGAEIAASKHLRKTIESKPPATKLKEDPWLNSPDDMSISWMADGKPDASGEAISKAISETRSVRELHVMHEILLNDKTITESKRAVMLNKIEAQYRVLSAQMQAASQKEAPSKIRATSAADNIALRTTLEKQTTLVGALKAIYDKATPQQKRLIDVLTGMGSLDGVSFKVQRAMIHVTSLNGGHRATNTSEKKALDGELTLIFPILDPSGDDKTLDPIYVLLHEAVHAATTSAEFTSAKHRRAIEQLLNHARAQMVKMGLDPDSFYGLIETQEFLAEAFTNPTLQALLAKMPAANTSLFKNLWQQFKGLVADILGLQGKDATLLDEVFAVGLDMARITAEARMGATQTIFADTAAAAGPTSIAITPTAGGKPTDYMSMLSQDSRRYLQAAFGRGDVRMQIEMLVDPETKRLIGTADMGPTVLVNAGIALVMQGKIKLGRDANNALGQLWDTIRNVLQLPSKVAYANAIILDLKRGRDARKIDAQAELLKPAALVATRFIQNKIRPAVRAFAVDIDQRMRSSGVPALTQLATLYSQRTGEFRSDDKTSFMRRTTDERNKRLNEFFKITRDWSDDKKLAITKMLQAEVASGWTTKSVPGKTSMVDQHEDLTKDLEAVRGFFRDQFEYMDKKGVKFGNIKNYFPVSMDAEKVAKNKDAFIALLNAPEFKEAVGDKAEELWRKAANGKGEQTLGDVTFADGKHTPTFKAANTRISAFIYKHGTQEQKDTFASFQDDKLDRIVATYVSRGVRRAEWTDLGLGPKSVELLAKAKEQGATDEQLQMGKDYVDQIMGAYGHDYHPMVKKIADKVGLTLPKFETYDKVSIALVTYQNLRLLPLALMSSLIDPIGVMVRGGTATGSFKAYREAVKAFRDSDGNDSLRAMAEDLGVIERHAVTEALIYMYGGGGDPTSLSNNLNAALFKYNGLEYVTKFSRLAALANAHRFLAKHGGAKPPADSSRYLEELGLTPADIQIGPDGRVLRNPKVDVALTRFVDESVVRPTMAQRPQWHNDPTFRLAAQYKGYLYSFWNTVVRRAGIEVNQGNYAVLVPILMYLPVTMAGEMLRDMAQGDDEDREMKDYAWLSVERSGLLGPHVNLLRGATQDMSYGHSALNSIAGPTGQQMGQLYDVMNGQRSVGKSTIEALPGSALYEDWGDDPLNSTEPETKA